MIILVIAGAVLWLFLGWMAARVLAYESIYYWHHRQTVPKWILRIMGAILLGPILWIVTIECEKESFQMAWGTHGQTGNPDRFNWFKSICANLLGIKDQSA